MPVVVDIWQKCIYIVPAINCQVPFRNMPISTLKKNYSTYVVQLGLLLRNTKGHFDSEVGFLSSVSQRLAFITTNDELSCNNEINIYFHVMEKVLFSKSGLRIVHKQCNSSVPNQIC